MLLLVSILCGIMYTVLSQEQRIVVTVSPDLVLEMRKYAEICGNENDVDPKVLRKMLDWTLPNDMPHKKFLYCITLKCGYIKDDGHFAIDKMMELETVNGTRADFEKNLQECNKITLGDKLDTTYEMGACLHRYHITVPRTNNPA